MVCVEYGDLLEITLPWNLMHFKEILVVTTPWDHRTANAVKTCGGNVGLYYTDSFYSNGALFNKWLALEEGIDSFGRHGVLSILDADILWPRDPSISRLKNFEEGYLYSPARRLQHDINAPIPVENLWSALPKFIDYEWAGYTQIFHASDYHLPTAPWHEINWVHAGGADSAFQNLWPRECKRRPSWEVLHLGPPGRNWCGRCTEYRDGGIPTNAQARRGHLQRFMNLRQRGIDPYRAEKI